MQNLCGDQTKLSLLERQQQNVDCVTAISMCAGGGGLDLGLSLVLENFRTIAYIEREAFAVEYLAQAMEKKILHQAPVWTDIRTFKGRQWRGVVDCIIAGYPCQPFSSAGHRRGRNDSRHLWPHIADTVREVEPAVVFFENVEGHVTLGLKEVLIDLQRMGFETAAGLFSAEEIGATFAGKRLYILGLAKAVCVRQTRQTMSSGKISRLLQTWSKGTSVDSLVFPPHAKSATWKEVCRTLLPTQSTIHMLDDGMATATDEWLTMYGNGVCPLQAAYAFVSLWSGLRGYKG